MHQLHVRAYRLHLNVLRLPNSPYLETLSIVGFMEYNAITSSNNFCLLGGNLMELAGLGCMSSVVVV